MTDPSLVSDDRPPRRLAHFQVTKQHRRFAEFADAVRRHRYIEACPGAPTTGCSSDCPKKTCTRR